MISLRLCFRSVQILGETRTGIANGLRTETFYDLPGVREHVIQGRWWWWVALLTQSWAVVFAIPLSILPLLVVNRRSGEPAEQAVSAMKRYCRDQKIAFVSEPRFAVPDEEWAKLPADRQDAGKAELARLAGVRDAADRRALRLLLLTGLVCYLLVLPLSLIVALEVIRYWVVAADRGLSSTVLELTTKFKVVWERNWVKFRSKLTTYRR